MKKAFLLLLVTAFTLFSLGSCQTIRKWFKLPPGQEKKITGTNPRAKHKSLEEQSVIEKLNTEI